jgi:hypothetical protein
MQDKLDLPFVLQMGAIRKRLLGDLLKKFRSQVSIPVFCHRRVSKLYLRSHYVMEPYEKHIFYLLYTFRLKTFQHFEYALSLMPCEEYT